MAALGSILLACGLSFAACSDEGENENDKPDIFEEIEDIYSELNGKTKCSEVSSYAVGKAHDNVKLKKACEKYNTSLRETAGGNVDKLVKNLDNSGYYLAGFLLLYRLTDQVSECTPDIGFTRDKAMTDWENLFNSNDCNGIIDKADSIAKKRGE